MRRASLGAIAGWDLAREDKRHAERQQLPAFTFNLDIRAATASGTAATPHTGRPVEWTLSGAVSCTRIVLLAESADNRLRNPSTRWRGELRGALLHLEQIGSQACNPTRAGTPKKS